MRCGAGRGAWTGWAIAVLAAAPFAGICLSVPLWDRIDPRVLGLPFNIFWLTGWMLVTPLCLYGAYRLGGHGEARRDAERGP